MKSSNKKVNKKMTKEEVFNGFSVLMRLFGNYRTQVIIFVLLGILSSFGSVSVPYLIGLFVDALSNPATEKVILGVALPLYVVVLIIWATVQIILVLISRYIARESDGLAFLIWADYLVAGLKHLIHLPLSFHKKKKIGEVFERIIMTADNIQFISGGIVIQLSPQILSVLIALTVTFYINVTLGFVLFFSLLLVVFTYVSKVSRLASMQKDMYEKSSLAWGDSYDYVMNARRVKEAVAEELVTDRISESFESVVAGGWVKVFRIWGSLGFYQEFIMFIAQLVVFVYSINAILGGWMTIGELLAVNGYTAMVFSPFAKITRTWQHIQNGIVNINETEKILLLEKEDYSPKESCEQSKIKGGIVFDSVSFNYESEKESTVFEDISFTVKPGETVAVVGESGVGKTTLMDMLLGFHFPTSGKILIDGCDIRNFDLKKLRRSVAIVSQDIVLFNNSIKENIAFAKGTDEVKEEKIKKAAELADAKEFIENFPNKWDQLVGERGIKLSGGQRQRIAIAQAFLADPKILILDEPTSALDARSEQKLHNSLKEFIRDKTTFIIAHRFSTVRNADKIIVLKDGRVVQTGSHEELLKIEGEYKKLYELQAGLES